MPPYIEYLDSIGIQNPTALQLEAAKELMPLFKDVEQAVKWSNESNAASPFYGWAPAALMRNENGRPILEMVDKLSCFIAQ